MGLIRLGYNFTLVGVVSNFGALSFIIDSIN